MSTIPKIDVEFIKQHAIAHDDIKEMAEFVFMYWHDVYLNRGKCADVESIEIKQDGIVFHTREYIGRGGYDYYEFTVPLDVIVAENYQEVIDELGRKRAEELKAEEIKKQAEAELKKQEKAARQVEADLAELARLESLYRKTTGEGV